MFDFEKLAIYAKAKAFNSEVWKFLNSKKIHSSTKDQLRRASFSIVLNIAEGSGRFSKPDRKNFYVISRSSVFECIAIFDVLRDEKFIDDESFNLFYGQGEEISKILFRMIQNLKS